MTHLFFTAILIAIVVLFIIDMIKQYKKKQLWKEPPSTITKPDVQSLFSRYKDKKKRKEKKIVEIVNNPKNFGQFLQGTGKQKWVKKNK